MCHIILRGGPFSGRRFDREHCELGMLLLITGQTSAGLQCQIYRVRLQCGGLFSAVAEPHGEGPMHRVLLP